MKAGSAGKRMRPDHVNASVAMHSAFANRNASRLNDVHAIVVMGLPLDYHLVALFKTHKFASATWKNDFACLTNAFVKHKEGSIHAHRHASAHKNMHACMHAR